MPHCLCLKISFSSAISNQSRSSSEKVKVNLSRGSSGDDDGDDIAVPTGPPLTVLPDVVVLALFCDEISRNVLVALLHCARLVCHIQHILFFLLSFGAALLFLYLHLIIQYLQLFRSLYQKPTHAMGYFISTLVVSSDGLVGVVFGRSTNNMPLFILAVTFEGTISSGIGILRLNDLYARSLYT